MRNATRHCLHSTRIWTLAKFTWVTCMSVWSNETSITKQNKPNNRFKCMILQLSHFFLSAGRLLGRQDNLKKSTVPYHSFALCAISYIGAMFASNQSLQHVNYPTQVLAKSAKPIAVMVVGFLIGGFRYPLRKCLYVLMISVGVVFFVYKEPVIKPKNASIPSGTYGIGELLLVSLIDFVFTHYLWPIAFCNTCKLFFWFQFVSLTLDGLTSLFQERMRSNGRVGPYQMMFQMNMWSILYLSAG